GRQAPPLGRVGRGDRPTPQGRYPVAAAAATVGAHPPARRAAAPLLGRGRRCRRRPPRSGPPPPRAGRPRRYGAEVAAAAEILWQASGRIGAHRLHPFVPELLDRLGQGGELSVAPTVDTLVRQASRPTLARLLAPARAQYPRRSATTTRPSTWLKPHNPNRTLPDWGAALKASTSTPWRPSMWPPAGSSCKRSGARGTIASPPACRPCASACRWPWSASTATTGPNSSIASCTTTAGGRASPSREAGPGRRTTAPSSSRRTAPLCASWSLMFGPRQAPPMPSSPASTPWPAGT